MCLRRLTDKETRANQAGAWLNRNTRVDHAGHVVTTSNLWNIQRRESTSGTPRHLPTLIAAGTHQDLPLFVGFFFDGSAFLAKGRDTGLTKPLQVAGWLARLDGVSIVKATIASPRHKVAFDRSGGVLRFDKNGVPLFTVLDNTIYEGLRPRAQAWHEELCTQAQGLWQGTDTKRFAMPASRKRPSPPWSGNWASSLESPNTDATRATWYAHARGAAFAQSGTLDGTYVEAPLSNGKGHIWFWMPTQFQPPTGRARNVPPDVAQAFVPKGVCMDHAVPMRRWDNHKLTDQLFSVQVKPSAHTTLAIAARAL